jgi:hypothetical protein
MATLLILEPIFEVDFEDCSFGFRAGRSAYQALDRIRETLRQILWWHKLFAIAFWLPTPGNSHHPRYPFSIISFVWLTSLSRNVKIPVMERDITFLSLLKFCHII